MHTYSFTLITPIVIHYLSPVGWDGFHLIKHNWYDWLCRKFRLTVIAYCFAQPIFVSGIWLCCDVTFLVTKGPVSGIGPFKKNNSDVDSILHSVEPACIWHDRTGDSRWKCSGRGKTRRVWDVTKNVTLQHNQIALTKIGCAKQYANHCTVLYGKQD